MKKINVLILLLVFVFSGAASALAESQGWWPGHSKWAQYKHFNPYLETGKDTQNTQWNEEDWYVQDWISQSKDEFTLIDGWFKTDILREQTEEGGLPVLVVGPMFYRLSGFDKRRVVTTLDAVYGITEKDAHPVVVLKDWRTKRQIGLYTKDGLQLE